MKTLKIRALLSSAILFACASANVSAASITLDTRGISSGVNNTDYRSSWSAQSSVINSQNLSDVNGAFGASNSFSHLKIDFSSADSVWGFQLAPDAGFGGALYLDNQLLAKDTSDLWWGYAWGNGSELLSSAANMLLAGNHVLEAYWAEGCCNGSMGGRFTLDGGQNWQGLSVANLNRVAIPNPDVMWLIGLGFISLAYVASKKQGTVLPVSA